MSAAFSAASTDRRRWSQPTEEIFMNAWSFATLTRRASLLAAAVAAPTALTSGFTAAKKNRSNKKLKKAKKACQQDPDTCLAQGVATCADQVEDCETTLQIFCGTDPACLEHRFCCPLIQDCDFPVFLDCLIDIN
jgi:hypothetical protein